MALFKVLETNILGDGVFRLSFDVNVGKGQRFLFGFCLFFMFLRGRVPGLDYL